MQRFMSSRTQNPVLALELFRQYKNKLFVTSAIIIYLLYFALCLAFAITLDVDDSLVAEGQLFVWPVRVGAYGGQAGILLDELEEPYAYAFYTMLPVLCMIVTVVPALAATSVRREHRQQTLMPVQLSLLRPFDIIWGKIVASVAPIAVPAGIYTVTLFLFALKTDKYWISSPIAGLVLMISTAFVVSAISVMFSTFIKNSAATIIASQVVAFLYCSFLALVAYLPILESSMEY